ncbi:hypothetical protein PAAG_01224 [Paracoccidioides lutzii Pb01]|uniref:GH16 domain-containing protein n=1 Tax=Paracoccidioides lutzii (strain ATCC MYA-826 / Pb01) TaxID=502779 RepID=C1GRS9_PARBA|nr:hypothetical protein PAAG_01224 [Paracoccidioides lutzii Pb01]EEH38303.2 hypothetical protein PAAG_01224 [Paracoccidioides lutzii Pb01]
MALGQTYTACDPLKKSCPPNKALGKSIEVDLTKGRPENWDLSKDIKNGENGGVLAIEKDGIKAELISNFYIMFGRVDVTMRTSPGQGVVSSVVLESDCGDEVDFEWIGHSERIVWKIDGATIRVATAAESGQSYPQTPALIQVGNWVGGDPERNQLETIEWAGGKVDYSAAPFVMYVKSIKVADYSTGRMYEYADQTGNWQSVKAVDGKINNHGTDRDTETSPSTITVLETSAASATSSKNNCGLKETRRTWITPGAECSNGASTTTTSTVGPALTNGLHPSSKAAAGRNGTAHSVAASTPIPSHTSRKPIAGERSEIHAQNYIGIGCVLFNAIRVLF